MKKIKEKDERKTYSDIYNRLFYINDDFYREICCTSNILTCT